MKRYIQIQKEDQVIVALDCLKKGEKIQIQGKEILVKEEVFQGHKMAIEFIKKGEPVIKYGHRIGFASEDIEVGSVVHIHNIKTALNEQVEYKYEPVEIREQEKKNYSFMGYKRANGRVGVRNELWILPTVGCVNSVAEKIAEEARELFGKDGIDGVVAFRHPYGCSQMGDDQENTREVLARIIEHPNAGGVLVLGLGCENSNIGVLKDYIKDADDDRVCFLQCQDVEDEHEEAIKLLRKLYEKASLDKRELCDGKDLVIGLKCGGSDGLSGITANPTVGAFSDLMVAAGGSTILTEVPEMFGAETILMNRCKDENTFSKTVKLIEDFKNYYIENHQTIYENPSPGNKKGGISTLEDKALGCTQKSGGSRVVDVLAYGEKIKEQGLNLLSAPGNDLVATTALAVSGAQIVLFTTGRGTPFASLVPTIKISSNSQIAKKKKNWIDFNAGVLVEEKELPELSEELMEYVLKVASGEKVQAEEAGYHDIAIFKKGVTL